MVKKVVSNNNDEKKRHTGPRRTEIARITKKGSLHTTFSKRKEGLFSKTEDLCRLAGGTAAVVIFSPAGKAYESELLHADSVIARFLKDMDGDDRHHQPLVKVQADGAAAAGVGDDDLGGDEDDDDDDDIMAELLVVEEEEEELLGVGSQEENGNSHGSLVSSSSSLTAGDYAGGGGDDERNGQGFRRSEETVAEFFVLLEQNRDREPVLLDLFH
ncbi:hypothetical protein Tsubulata_011184 [Turnera subulata]|uniref:MADS-box domain-containing protein n=1 Tax=Turnera subulata TaxID=218843 RepID=A0A9Q0F841_9ROSI|nr:hypothetical protein Tsubulata_011184 [Turnera subulata]